MEEFKGEVHTTSMCLAHIVYELCGVSYLIQFNEVREHDDHTTLSAGDHLPEVSGSRTHRSLCDDEGSSLLITLQTQHGTTSCSIKQCFLTWILLACM